MKAFYAGGNYNNGSNAGVFYLNGNNPRSNSNTNIGFRSALPYQSEVICLRVYIQYEGVKDSISVPTGKKQKQDTGLAVSP